eukprot:TRINITY_DN73000_c0_g1_i1.p1 TRINITY_DN73000_c0_g1~~TRINITY_DN73000_c0_g1_i1.p1  ORF type:complete len:341 (+),score=101.39 TRINITY_DN73000_c0_g1_i1:84-1106(+)
MAAMEAARSLAESPSSTPGGDGALDMSHSLSLPVAAAAKGEQRPVAADAASAATTAPAASPSATPPAQAATAPSSSSFAQTLALRTNAAPERLAEKLIEKLQQRCLEEASVGRSSVLWDAQLPGSRRFSDAVARAFSKQLRDLGFSRLEWWTGKTWQDIPGKYCLLHDAMYDKYNLRIRGRWPEVLDGSETAATADGSAASASAGARSAVEAGASSAALGSVLRQLNEVVALQQELLLKTASAQQAAERRAATAERRALAAEQLCLEHSAAAALGRQDQRRRSIMGSLRESAFLSRGPRKAVYIPADGDAVSGQNGDENGSEGEGESSGSELPLTELCGE